LYVKDPSASTGTGTGSGEDATTVTVSPGAAVPGISTAFDVVTLDSAMSSGHGGGAAVVADACATSAARRSVSGSAC